MSTILAVIRRGSLVETRYRGDVAVVDCHGRLLYQAGSPDLLCYFRSAAKPLQALTVARSGAIDRFGFTEAEIAIMCASHQGFPYHAAAVAGILRKIGLSEADLTCGSPVTYPGDSRQHHPEQQGPIWHECSGKHSAMLALAVHRGWPTQGYYAQAHPVQQAIRDTVVELSGVPGEALPLASELCGVVTFGLPLRAMALAYARLSTPGAATLPDGLATAAQRVTGAMARHPEMISAQAGYDSLIIAASGGRILAKSGGGGILCACIVDQGLGVAVKLEDSSTQAAEWVLLEVLERLELCRPSEHPALRPYFRPEFLNGRGEVSAATTLPFRLRRGKGAERLD